MKKGYLKPIESCKLDNLDFLKLDSPEKAYTYGLLMADGYITSNNNSLWLYMISEDMNELKKILSKCLPFSYYNRQLSGGRKPQTGAYLYSSYLFTALLNSSFYSKSNKISLTCVEKNYLVYYLRGYFDGDGCFFIKKYSRGKRQYYVRQFNVSAGINFDWSELENLLKSIKVEYKIAKYQYSKSGFSRLIVTKKESLRKLVLYLYEDLEFESLSRKKNKAFEILKSI